MRTWGRILHRISPLRATPPTTRILTPTDGSTIDEDTFTITGTARDDEGIAAVFVKVGPNVAQLASTNDLWHTWTFEAHAPLGTFAIEA